VIEISPTVCLALLGVLYVLSKVAEFLWSEDLLTPTVTPESPRSSEQRQPSLSEIIDRIVTLETLAFAEPQWDEDVPPIDNVPPETETVVAPLPESTL